ncbi:MAG: cysteine-rich CWC family protein [Burkholderiales bacterium]|nr:cysteine-rich CWC family protein [Burkholderiales bacterium]
MLPCTSPLVDDPHRGAAESGVAHAAHRCPLCGAPNACQVAGSGGLDGPCWCTAVAISPAVLQSVPAGQHRAACLCRACATRDQPAAGSA